MVLSYMPQSVPIFTHYQVKTLQGRPCSVQHNTRATLDEDVMLLKKLQGILPKKSRLMIRRAYARRLEDVVLRNYSLICWVMSFLQMEFINGSVLRGCAGLKTLTAGRQVHAYAVKSGVEINVVVGSSLAYMYIKSGSLTEGDKELESRTDENTTPVPAMKTSAMSTNTKENSNKRHVDDEPAVSHQMLMITKGVCKKIRRRGFEELLFDMLNDHSTYNMVLRSFNFRISESSCWVMSFLQMEFINGSVLRGCAGLKTLTAGRQVHAYAVKSGVEINVVVRSSLAYMYIKSGSLTEGDKVIKSMSVHSFPLYNTLITGRTHRNGNL
ncbi:Pentatricopeptide repeat-containing protein [Artemisia annua]|uniref:Pentatricopeptide repeat-containing protein n=1 Tax=Artemisia annua TaxID=35608 RepID=A0A2U1NTX0_ARTAN|nr:Pentatricopeptide repeat-containing protein [Artemisia annua]